MGYYQVPTILYHKGNSLRTSSHIVVLKTNALATQNNMKLHMLIKVGQNSPSTFQAPMVRRLKFKYQDPLLAVCAWSAKRFANIELPEVILVYIKATSCRISV